ncbi:MAG: AAA family ATPase, partial [Candidatus Riflebacteria bacterium]|nr:AAA family ATPase [Candidatus Riflebacteria bacterium]
MAQVFDWPLAMLIELVQKANPLVKEGIVRIRPPKDIAGLLDEDLSTSIIAQKTLLGLPLTTDEFLAIDGTPLAKLLPGTDEGSSWAAPEMADALPTMTPAGSGQVAQSSPGATPPGKTAAGLTDQATQPPSAGEGETTAPTAGHPDEAFEPFFQDPLPGGQGGTLLLASGTGPALPVSREGLSPYTSDLEYLDDCFQRLAPVLQAFQMDRREAQHGPDPQKDQEWRELRAREHAHLRRIGHRLALTRKTAWFPRLELLRKSLRLSRFEVDVLLLLLGLRNSSLVQRLSDLGPRPDAGGLLKILTRSLEERIRCQACFYPKAPLVAEGVIHITNRSGLDQHVSEWDVRLDFRMSQYLMGVDHEIEALLDGTHLFTPKADIDQVVLPPEQKKLILDAVLNYEAFRKSRKDLGFDDLLPYGSGFAFLFYGPSGTGKTLMANAIARHLGKKILLVNFPELGYDSAGVLKFLFREARLQNALVFFDECESLFESRHHGNSQLGLLLTELERHDDLVIMATNRPYDLDEAMYRRITHAIEFRHPDPLLRRQIWANHLPARVRLAPDVDLKALGHDYEIAGGFIKNAVLHALSRAVARRADAVVLTHDDLDQGAR